MLWRLWLSSSARLPSACVFRYTLKDESLSGNSPLVSTVVPARNEERNIERCIRGLTHQDYPHLELVFVDDDSNDATPDILARHAEQDRRVKVVHIDSKPDGWNGEQWAYHSGATATLGDWLCFMDADTYAEPYLLKRAVAFALARRVDNAHSSTLV